MTATLPKRHTERKKKKCEHQKSQEQQIFSHKQTVTEWTVNWEELSQSEERS